MVAHACHVYTCKVETEDYGSRPAQAKVREPCLKNKPGMVAHSCTPSYLEAEVEKSWSKANQRQNHKTLSISKPKAR
jgi:hypothetical protein